MAQRLEQMFDEDVQDASLLDLNTWPRRGLARRVGESTCRLFSPIL